MTDQTAAALYFLAPFMLLWLAFTAAETVKAVAVIRGGRNVRD
jgi:hypothetical protein